MRKAILSIAGLFVSFLLFAQEKTGLLVKEGISLHDRGYYEEAILKYDSAIRLDEKFYLAHYEKSLTLLELKKYEDCIRISQWLLENHKKNDNNMSVYINYASCLDYLGKKNESIKVFDAGIKQFPKAGMLYFNKAVTLVNMNENAEALETIKSSIINNPTHASSHNLLRILVSDRNKVYGIMASMIFLSLEPQSSRSREALSDMEKLMGANVKKTGEKAVTINLSLDQLEDKKKKRPDDFGSAEMMMAFSTALGEDEKFKNETAVQRMNRNLEIMIASLRNSQKKSKGFGWEFYAPFVIDMKAKEHLETFCHIAYVTTDDPENNKWLSENKVKINAFFDWLKAYKWKNDL